MPAPFTDPDQFASLVRGYIRDFPELNRLISLEESSNRMIVFCAYMALDEFNTTPPLIGNFSIADFPSGSILISLTICHLLTSVGILKSRNRFSYSDGGWSADTEQQDQAYMQWVRIIRGQVQPQAQNLKVALNIRGGWGAGVGSEYGWLHGWYGIESTN